MKHNTLFDNLKPARPAFLAALMLITFAAAVIPAAAQSSPPAVETSPPRLLVPIVEAQAVPVEKRPVGPGVLAPTSLGAYCTYRIHGWYYLYCNWGAIDNNSTVLEAISEYSPYPWDRFIGAASMQIFNISPYSYGGGVKSLVYVNWGSDLNVRLDVLTTN